MHTLYYTLELNVCNVCIASVSLFKVFSASLSSPILSELSSTLIERMQVQELMLSGWQSELEKLFHLISSTPTAVLFGFGALTGILAYWLSIRPRATVPPCDLLHQSEEIEVFIFVSYL